MELMGQVALVSRSDHKRTADVKALCSCELFELSREVRERASMRAGDVHTDGYVRSMCMCFLPAFPVHGAP